MAVLKAERVSMSVNSAGASMMTLIPFCGSGCYSAVPRVPGFIEAVLSRTTTGRGCCA